MHRCIESRFHFRSFGLFQASCFRNQKAKHKHPIISIRINNHGFSVCCAGYRSSWHGNFFQRDFPQEEGNDLAKVGDKTEVDGSMGSMGCLHWRFHVMFAKTNDVQDKDDNDKKCLESSLRSVLHVARSFFREKETCSMASSPEVTVYQWYIIVFGKMALVVMENTSFLTCHLEPNPSGPEEIWERNSTLRLAGGEKVGSWGPWCDQ